MKKFISLLLILSLIFSFAACGGQDSNDVEISNVEDSINTEKIAKTFEVDSQYCMPFGKEPKVPEIEECTIYDTEKYKIDFKGIEYVDVFGGAVKAKFEFENKTDEEVSFIDLGTDIYIDGWKLFAIDRVGDGDIKPNSKANVSYYYPFFQFKLRHIDHINNIDILNPYILEDSYFEGTEFKREVVCIDPVSLKTNDSEKNSDYVPDGTVIYEDKGVKVILLENCFYSDNIYCYVENNSDKYIAVDNLTQIYDGGTKYRGNFARFETAIPSHTKDIFFIDDFDQEANVGDIVKIKPSIYTYDFEAQERGPQNDYFEEGERYQININ